MVKLSVVIAIWELLHIKDTGDIGFCDLAEAIEKVEGVEIDKPCLSELNK